MGGFRSRYWKKLRPGLGLLLLVGACGDDDPTGPLVEGRLLYGVTLGSRLISFQSDAPGTLLSNVAITGPAAGERIVSIDVRPADGQLYGVGSDDRVYRIDRSTGVAVAVGEPFGTALDGEHFGLAIGSSDDQIRTSSAESEQNLRLNPDDGLLAGVDADFAFAPGDPNAGTNPSVAGLAITTTGLYGIESNRDVLVRIANPSSGALTTVGPLGANTVPCAAFDVDTDGLALAALADNGPSRLFSIDLTTGAATLIGEIAGNFQVQGIAFAP